MYLTYPVYKYIGKVEKCNEIPVLFPAQHQNQQPGLEYIMNPRPISENPYYKGSNKLKDKVAIITGGDSGIGRAVAYVFAKEGADIVISYLNEQVDAEETKNRVEDLGRRCILVPGDLKNEEMSNKVVNKTLNAFKKIDILVNNHSVAIYKKNFLDISAEQLDMTFRTNIYSFFYMTKAVIPHLKKGSSIINTTSAAATIGYKDLIDYSASKGAIISFTRSLSLSLVSQGIRVNAVAPGPTWTPLIPSTFPANEVQTYGSYTPAVPMNRTAQPYEIATSYVFLASDDSSYMTGQILQPNGGIIT